MAKSEAGFTININLDHCDATMDLIAALAVMAKSDSLIPPGDIGELVNQWTLAIDEELQPPKRDATEDES